MSDVNELEAVKNLQATSKIISILEKSKNFIEEWADRSPECLTVFEQSGRLVKANKLALKILESQEKTYLDEYIFKVFDSTSKNILQTCMADLVKKADDEPIEVELIFKNSTRTFVFHCSLSLLSSKIFRDNPLFTLSGRDLTKIREYERTLAEIFNNIPLGIITIDREGLIRTPYSKYTEYLLNDPTRGSDLKDRNYYECLFSRAEKFLSSQDIAMAKLLVSCIGEPKYVFDNMSGTFPRYIVRAAGSTELTLCLSYHPIVRNGIEVEEIMVIVEDVTTHIGRNIASIRNKEVAMVNYILDLQKADQGYLRKAFSYIAGHIVAIDQFLIEEHLPGVLDVYSEIASEFETAKLNDLSAKIKDFVKVLDSKKNMSEVLGTPEVLETHSYLRSAIFHLEKFFQAMEIAKSQHK